MGFNYDYIKPIATGTASIIAASSNKRQSKQLAHIADEEERMGRRYSESAISTATSNSQRAAKNAQSELARARLDTATSGLAFAGSAQVRETDLASRLEDDIKLQTDSALQQANKVREQARLDAYSTNMSAQAAETRALGNIIEGIGGVFDDLNDIKKDKARKKALAYAQK